MTCSVTCCVGSPSVPIYFSMFVNLPTQTTARIALRMANSRSRTDVGVPYSHIRLVCFLGCKSHTKPSYALAVPRRCGSQKMRRYRPERLNAASGNAGRKVGRPKNNRSVIKIAVRGFFDLLSNHRGQLPPSSPKFPVRQIKSAPEASESAVARLSVKTFSGILWEAQRTSFFLCNRCSVTHTGCRSPKKRNNRSRPRYGQGIRSENGMGAALRLFHQPRFIGRPKEK